MTLELRRERLDARQRGVATVKKEDAPVSTVASWSVASGRPGPA